MVATSCAREARKPAPSCAKSSRSKPVVFGALTPAEIGASAIAAREYGSKVAPKASRALPARVVVVLEDFDRGHAEEFAKVHGTLRRRYRSAYGKGYPRTIHADWTSIRELVRGYGAEYVEVAIERMFDDELFVAAGIDSMLVVKSWAPAVLRRPSGGKRLTRDERAMLHAVIRQHAALVLA